MKGKLISGASSASPGLAAAACACWALRIVALSVWSISSVGKYVVSIALVRRGSNGARMRRSESNSTPRKKAWLLISCAPLRPRRFSVLMIRLFRGQSVCAVIHWSLLQSGFLPPNQILGLRAQSDIVRKVQALPPVDNLAIGIVAVLGTERGPAHQTLEHDCSQAPPVAVKGVAVPGENFWGNVVGGSDCRVGHEPSASSPIVDLGTIRNGQVDLIQGDRVTVTRTVRLALQELLVIVVVVELVKARRQTEIGQLDVATAVQ